ncbi:hypothetical protein L6452_19376 [Arctium lappa]|uniref:Uncharacterized protein n=1 Tax=Arctium lappa TaxID=4217 RepID=A0ACB9B7V1_ARCLA|nr:hypothetical protein L6452_19376 [Arctium lappa]
MLENYIYTWFYMLYFSIVELMRTGYNRPGPSDATGSDTVVVVFSGIWRPLRELWGFFINFLTVCLFRVHYIFVFVACSKLLVLVVDFVN